MLIEGKGTVSGEDVLENCIRYWRDKLQETPLPYNADRILQTVRFLEDLRRRLDEEKRPESYYVTSH